MCEDDGHLTVDAVRLVLIIGMGTTVCIIGIVLNTLLLMSFSRLEYRSTNLLYLFLLAFFDIFVEICFMADKKVWTDVEASQVKLRGDHFCIFFTMGIDARCLDNVVEWRVYGSDSTADLKT